MDPPYAVKKVEKKPGEFSAVRTPFPKTHASYKAWAVAGVLSDAKEAICKVADTPFDPTTTPPDPTGGPSRRCPLSCPTGREVTVGLERFAIPEALFRPAILSDLYGLGPPYGAAAGSPPMRSIPGLIRDSIAGADVDVKRELFSSVLLTGGSSQFAQLRDRIERDLVDGGVDGAEASAAAANVKPKVSAPMNSTERRFAVWIGGSILAPPGSRSTWASKAEYEEHGKSLTPLVVALKGREEKERDGMDGRDERAGGGCPERDETGREPTPARFSACTFAPISRACVCACVRREHGAFFCPSFVSTCCCSFLHAFSLLSHLRHHDRRPPRTHVLVEAVPHGIQGRELGIKGGGGGGRAGGRCRRRGGGRGTRPTSSLLSLFHQPHPRVRQVGEGQQRPLAQVAVGLRGQQLLTGGRFCREGGVGSRDGSRCCLLSARDRRPRPRHDLPDQPALVEPGRLVGPGR